jgi:Heavy metal associated domain 2
MSLSAAELVLEILAGHILPTLAVEVGRYAWSRGVPRPEASRPVGKPQATEKPVVKRRAHHLKLVEGASLLRTTRITSQTPGRVRLEVDGTRGAPWRADEMATRLREIAGVNSASVSPLTGTALIEYDPEITTPTRILADSALAGPNGPGAVAHRRPAAGPIALPLVEAGHRRRLGPTSPPGTGQLPLAGLCS